MSIRPRLYLCLLIAGVAFAQSDRGNITGLVTDPSGAVVPAAKVTAIQVTTNVARSTVASSSGEFTITNLPVGAYRVDFEAAGFKTLSRSNIVLSAGSTVRVDATLTVGQISESVSVTAEAALIQTDSARVTTAVSPKFVEDLPLVVGGQLRSPLDLVLVAPETKANYNISVGGGQEGGWDMTVDGISVTPAAPFEQRLWSMYNTPSVDAIQEFAVDTNGFKAEYGRAGGGQFNFVSKSGTNELHGTAYEFLRNQAMDANYFFNNANRLPKTIQKQHDLGGTIGGPVYLPKIYNGKNKTFFFFSYEGFRQRQGAPTNYRTIPLPEMYQGDFTNWKDKTGNLIPIYDPSTTRSDGKGGFVRDPFAGNMIPQGRFSTVAKNVIPLATMRPNTPDPTGILNPNPRNNFITVTGASTQPWNKFSIKGDHLITDRQRLAFMFQRNEHLQLVVGSPPGLPVPLNNDFQYGNSHTKVYRLTYDYTITPTILNHLSAGINDEGQYRGATMEQVNKGWAPKLGIKNVSVPDLLFPQFAFDGYSTWGRAEYGGSYNKTWAATDDLSISRGKHAIKLGFTFQEDHYNGYGNHTASGSFSFSRMATSRPLDQSDATGNGFASFLLGQVASANMQTPRIVSDQWRYYAWYVQDDWRATRKLTISYGLRWEYTPPTVEGRFPDGYSNFNPNLPNPGAGGRLGAIEFAGFGEGRVGRRTLYDGWPWGFGPRLGMAYSLNDKTVIRLSAARSFGSVKNTGGSSHFDGYIGDYNWTTTDSSITPAFLLDDGYPFWPKPPFLKPDFLNGKSAKFWQSYDAGRLPEFYNWNLNIQRQLPGNMALEVGYSATLGHHLTTNLVNLNQVNPAVFFGYVSRLGFDSAYSLMSKSVTSAEAVAAGVPIPYAGFTGSVRQALKPFPQYTSINTAGDGGDRSGNSTYHALVIKWEKRYSSGLTFLNSYVLSKFFTDAERANASSIGAMDHYNRRLEKTLSENDQTHSVKSGFSYELPFGKGKKWANSGVVNHLAGGWRLAGLLTYWSGAPISVSPGYGLPLDAGAGNRISVVDYEGWRAATGTGHFDPNKDRWWDGQKFSSVPGLSAPSGVKGWVLKTGFGSATVRNPKTRAPWNLNESVSLARTFRISEQFRLEFRGESFNLFNRVRWGSPDSTVTSNNFGRVTSQANTPRQMQLGLKLYF